MDVAHQLQTLHQELADLAEASLLAKSVQTLVAVSKFQPIERVQAALEAGHRCFGENQCQDASARWEALKPRYPDLQLHFIGSIQSRKLKEICGLFDVIETLEREKIAHKLADWQAETGEQKECFIQVNTGEEPQKGGVNLSELPDFLGFCQKEKGLNVTWLMCIPPVEDDAALHFALMRKLADRHALPNLSMGMSGDYQQAVQFGATHVRIGTGVFGARD